MTNHPNRGRIPRPLTFLHSIKDDYPNAWSQLDELRRDRGTDIPNWPDWCFCPMSAWYAVVSSELQVKQVSQLYIADVAKLAALGAWRYTQSIYRFDNAVYQSLIETVPRGAIPADVIYRIPEWCVYIETPGMQWMSRNLAGFFAHLEYDVNTERHELRLLLDTDDELIPIVLHLGAWTITEAIDRSLSETVKQAKTAGVAFNKSDDLVMQMSESVYSLISLLLYVCSDGVEYNDDQRPSKAKAKRTKKGWRLFPAAKPRYWDLGKKTGDLIRAGHSGGGSGKKAPHIRRAHWHSFWLGSGDEKKITIKWLPPIPVASDNKTEQ